MSRTAKEMTEWQEQFCWFGSANWPSDLTYRTDGKRVQVKTDHGWEDLTTEEDLERYRSDITHFGPRS